MELLHQGNAERLSSLVGLKYQRMSMSAFIYFRGAASVMAYDLALAVNSEIVTQLCGDAHIQNLGSYAGLDDRLIFDINDFDETIRGPFEWDVKRMATSILLGGQDAKLKKSSCLRAAESFLTAYCGLVQKLSLLPVLETARYQVHRLTGIAPVSKVLRKAERATPVHARERLMEQTEEGLRFRTEPPLLHRVTGEEREAVLAALPKYMESLLPERRHFFRQFTARDVGFKVVGTGSIGLRDYCVYMEGNGIDDPLLLQLKQEAPSVYAPYLPKTATDAATEAAAALPGNQGQRVVEGQRAMQLQSDPLLGWTTLHGQGYLVRQLNDHKAAIDIAALNGAGLEEYGTVCGEMLARGHARAGDAHLLAGYIGDGKQFIAAILAFAESYASQTVSDWEHFVLQLKRL